MALPQLQQDFRDKDTQDFLTTFKNKGTGKYNIKNLSYPENLGKDPDVQHYVAFFINVRGKSKFNKQVGVNGNQQKILDDVVVGTGQNRLDPNRTGDQILAAGIVGGAQIGGASGLLSNALEGKFSPAKIASTVAKSVVGAAAGAATIKGAEALGAIEPDTLKRISDVITLHIQDKPSTNYSVNYQDKEIGTLGGLLAGGSSMTDMTESMRDIGKDVGQAGITALVAAVSTAFGGPAGNLLELGTKQKTNSFREQFFESVDFRTFNFRHTFMPRSPQEAENIKRILNLFKFHMHPELSKAGLFYIYPSEFEIKYFYRDKENTYFDKISSCVLEDMSVDYGGDIFSTFEDGNPVEINLTLKFKELELLTKDRITQGY
jgi:hypothetical protein